MASLDDVARAAGVSTASVSRALSGRGSVSPATREAVEQAAAKLGYVVSSSASSLASGRHRNIGVAVPKLSNWFFSRVIEGVQLELVERGYDMTLYRLPGEGAERQHVFGQYLHRKRVDGLIAVSPELREAEAARLASIEKPLVGVGNPSPGVLTIAIDDAGVARTATELLLHLGHRSILHVSGPNPVGRTGGMVADRRSGYRAAMQAAGVPEAQQVVLDGAFTIEGGHAAFTRHWLKGGRPTAVFAASDEMAIGAILAARDLGVKVPEQLSVVGIDGHYLADFFGLTTFAQYPREQGRMAVGLIVNQLEGAPVPHEGRIDLEAKLELRSSTAAPPGQ